MKQGLLFAVGVAFVLIGVGVLVMAIRRQRADPHVWIPRKDSVAVQRALRDGHTDDPRLDALARSAATRAIKQRWMVWLLPLGVLLFAAGAVGDLRDPDTTWWDLGGSAASTTIAAIALVQQMVKLRRSRCYLRAGSPRSRRPNSRVG